MRTLNYLKIQDTDKKLLFSYLLERFYTSFCSQNHNITSCLLLLCLFDIVIKADTKDVIPMNR